MTKIKFSRGYDRLADISRMPITDNNSFVKYEGSISKVGDNADWDWGMYTDQNGEWVLMEADGPGCIFNFTQHRYPTSEVPTFRFYFDNSPTPQFEIKPSQFGTKYPFIKPLADKFVGPEDNGRGPIWVVRSFVPMEFTTHCKVTSDIKLEGADKDAGQGGWGHVMYHLYDSAEGLTTFSADLDVRELAKTYNSPLSIGTDHTEKKTGFKLGSASKQTVFSLDSKATLSRIRLSLDFKPEILSDIWIRICFDDEECVYAPLGTFFGCEYGKTPASIETALITFDNINGRFENRYPMPFFKNCTILLENRSERQYEISSFEVGVNTSLCYDPADTMLFRSSKYYEKTENTPGKNSVIANICGSGSMVYGVISGEDIACGCEGDVRVFIDGVRSPIVESDGSESWGSYGWGFVCPPQCNPFSAYNGIPDINDTWSELRLTFADNYTFRKNLRFELEHGCQNDGGGYHSGQVFYYGNIRPAVIKTLEISPKSEYYVSDGKISTVKDRFENGIHEEYKTFNHVTGQTATLLTLDLPGNASSVILKRVCVQKTGPMEAAVFVNDVRVAERNWLSPDSNEFYGFFEDDFVIPKKYVENQSRIAIKIVPLTESFNDCGYTVDII